MINFAVNETVNIDFVGLAQFQRLPDSVKRQFLVKSFALVVGAGQGGANLIVKIILVAAGLTARENTAAFVRPRVDYHAVIAARDISNHVELVCQRLA